MPQTDTSKWGAPVVKTWHGDKTQVTGYRAQKTLATIMFTVMITAVLLILTMG